MRLTGDQVDLTYHHDRLTGVLASELVDVSAELPRSTGPAAGTFGDAGIMASWSIGSNYQVAEVTAYLEGTLGELVVSLTAAFHLLDATTPALVGATVLGTVGDERLTAAVAPRGERFVDRSVLVDGLLGPISLSLMATVKAYRGQIEGTVDNEPVELASRRVESRPTSHRDRTVEIRGRWHGPPVLGLLAATGLVYWT